MEESYQITQIGFSVLFVLIGLWLFQRGFTLMGKDRLTDWDYGKAAIYGISGCFLIGGTLANFLLN